MYLTRYQKKQLITLIVLVIGIPLTIFAGYHAVQWFTDASADTEPKNVVIGNITTSSVTITWTTSSRAISSIVPILDGREMAQVTDRRGARRRITHYVELRSLEPGTEYNFKIVSGGERYTDSGGQDFSFTTANISRETPVPKPIHGDIKDGSGEDVLIYVFTKDKSTYPIITTPSANGNWLVDLSALRKISDKSVVNVGDSTELVVVAVSDVDSGGFVEGKYGDIFDSSGKLNQNLVSSGSDYVSHIPDKARLVATQKKDDPPKPDPRPDPRPDPEPDLPPIGGIGEDEEDERVIRTDLVWLNLVSEDDASSGRPDIYGEESVSIVNRTDVSFTVLWFSEQKETGHVMYGVSKGTLDERARDERDGIATQNEYYLHSIEVSSLVPETTYYFEIHSGDEVFDNSGSKYEITTFETQSSPPPFERVEGSIEVEDNDNVVILARIIDDDGIGSSGSSLPVSALVDSRGEWIISIGGARTETGGYFQNSSDDIIEFAPFYLSNIAPTRKKFSEAVNEKVNLPSGTSLMRFVRVPLLENYGLVIL